MSGSSSRSKRAACTILACVLWAGSALALDPALEASQYGHTAWRIGEEFAQARITSFAQGSDGYLWLGTEAGVLRFDGARTLRWTPPRGARLPHNHVRVLFAARDGLLWIGTLTGLASWDGRKLLTYPPFDGRVINALHEDREGTLWVGATPLSGDAGGQLCAIRNGTVECRDGDGKLGIGIGSLYEQSNGVLWAAGGDRVWRWKPGPQKAYPVPDRIPSLQALGETESGAMIVGTLNGIRQIAEDRVEPHSLPGIGQKLRATAVLHDRDGALWIGARDAGLIHIHGGRADSFASAQGLSGDHVTRFFEDREGNIWVATVDGIDRFRARAATIHGKSQGVDSPGSVLQTRDGGIWVSTATGVKHWDGGRFADVDVRGLPKTGMASLFQDRGGRIWIGSQSGLGYVEHGSYISIKGVPGGYIDSFAEDNHGDLWVAHRARGVLRISGGHVDTAWEKKSAFQRRLAADPVRGGIWIGSFSEGLFHFVDGRMAASYSIPDERGGGLIYHVSVTADGTVWAAGSRGLSRIKDGRIATLGSGNGLPCDEVYWTIEDAEQVWWLFTGCGVVRLAQAELDAWSAAADSGKAPRRIVSTVLDSSDGVRSVGNPGSFSPHAVRSGDGKLWFVDTSGLVLIDPRRLHVNKEPPPVHIEGIVADRVTYESSSGVHLPPLVRDLEIQYTATSLVAPEKTRFKYRLEGRDRDWNDAGNRRQAFYTDLDPGSYRFRVIAANNSGVWNEQGASLEFSVAPAYWQTGWFRILCVAALAALLWGLYRWRVRQIAGEFSMTLDARVAERTRIARELHDTLLQGFHGVLLKFQTVFELLPASEAKRILGSTIDQAAAAITEGRDAVQGLRASATERNDLAESIRSFADELAAEGGGEVAVRIEVLGVPRPTHPIVRDEIFRIAGEALRNALRHAGAQRIEVELRYDPRQLRLGVRDDGRGIAPEVLDAGGREGHFGMHGMRERAKVIGGKLTVWSAAEAGTEVELTVPAANAYAARPEGKE